jgi:hypothetical protein
MRILEIAEMTPTSPAPSATAKFADGEPISDKHDVSNVSSEGLSICSGQACIV